MTDLIPNLSICTLNLNALTTPIKIQRQTHWIKNMTQPYAVYKKVTSNINDIDELKVKEWKMICHENINQKKARMAVLIPYKVDLRANKITRKREVHYIKIKGSIYHENITVLNVYHQTTEAHKICDATGKT